MCDILVLTLVFMHKSIGVLILLFGNFVVLSAV